MIYVMEVSENRGYLKLPLKLNMFKNHDDQPSNLGNSIFKQTRICAWMEQVSLMKVIYLGV